MVNSTNISGVNSGPNSSKTSTPTAEMGPSFISAASNHSITATLAAGPLNDLGYALLGSPYSASYTNRMILTAATNSGNGTTINGLDAHGVDDGMTKLIQNPSTTDPLIFTHLNSGSLPNNQFSNESAGSVQIPPLGAARCTYIINKWQFA
jgi:hypothetical protein